MPSVLRAPSTGVNMICVECGAPAPGTAASIWLAAHAREDHHLPRRLECRHCTTHASVTSLRDVRDWAWRHGTCGLPSLPEFYSVLTRKTTRRRARSTNRASRRQRAH